MRRLAVLVALAAAGLGVSAPEGDAQTCANGMARAGGIGAEVPRTCAGPQWDDHCAGVAPWGEDQLATMKADACVSILEIPDPGPQYPG